METSPESTGETLFDPTLFVAATPVSLSAPQALDEENTTLGIFGRTSEPPLANYDPDTQSWKMFGDISLWGDCPSLETLPPSGIARNGALFQRPPWEPIIGEIASSLLHTPTGKMNQMSPSMASGKRSSGWWPTPTAVTRPMEGNVRLYRAKIEAGEMTEEEATAILGKSPFEAQGKIPAMWPTPQSNDHKNAVVRHRTKSLQVMLGGAVAASDPSLIGGRLNPMWVEWLMGFPLGWTDLKDSETPSSHK